MIKGVIDRIEGDFLVIELENGEMLEIKNTYSEAGEGVCVLIQNNVIVSFDFEETERRKKIAIDRLEKLKKRF